MALNRFAFTNVTTPGAALHALDVPAEGTLDYAKLNRKRPLGGGSDLLGEIKEGLFAPAEIVNLKPVAGWSGIRAGENGALEIGATTTVAEIAESADVRGHSAALAEAAGHVGSPQIRNQGTLGGNLCQRPRCWYYRHVDTVCLKKDGKVCFAIEGENKYHAIFGQEAPCRMVSGTNLGVALLAVDGSVTVHSAGGAKAVPAAEFFRMPTTEDPYRETNLGPGELVAGVSAPRRDGWRSAYMQISEKADFDWALVSAAASVKLDADGTVADSRIALNAVAPVPWRLEKAEAFLRGKKPDEAALRESARLALADAKPLAHNGYKVTIARALVVRVMQRALGEAA